MNILAMILAGGEGRGLGVLTSHRAEAAVPFGGKYRLVDFSLSNCVNSGIYSVGVLTQYQPRSLNDHIAIGKPWDLDRARGGVRLLQPFQSARGAAGTWQEGTADAERRLQQRQTRGMRQVEVEAHRLIDRQFQRRRPRPAAQDQRHGKGGQAQREHRRGRPGQHLAQHRTFQMARDVAGGEGQALGQPQPLGRDRLPALQDHPGGKRQVQEDMRQHHALHPVDRDRRQPEGGEDDIHRPLPPEQRQQAHDRDGHRQQEGRAHHHDHRPPPGKPPPCQRLGQGHRQRHRQGRRHRRLHQREAQRTRIGRGKRQPPRRPGHRHQGRSDHHERRSAYCDSAACHSASAALRIASASSAVISRDFSGRWVSNPAGRGIAVAGYIQFVVGITDWNAASCVKARNSRARSGWSEDATTPATSTCR